MSGSCVDCYKKGFQEVKFYHALEQESVFIQWLDRDMYLQGAARRPEMCCVATFQSDISLAAKPWREHI